MLYKAVFACFTTANAFMLELSALDYYSRFWGFWASYILHFYITV
nr:MAG TPA: hypothetical protein [Bacteriophage sp.]